MVHWTELKDHKDADTPSVPKITKTLIITKRTEAFQDFLHQVFGAHYIPLAYVIQPDKAVPAVVLPLANNQPYSTEHVSVKGELIVCALHVHPLFCSDNKLVYHYLEEATRSTMYSPSLKPFQRRKDGHTAWHVIVSQYAGKTNGM